MFKAKILEKRQLTSEESALIRGINHAILTGDEKALKALLDKEENKKPFLNEIKNNKGWSPFHSAIFTKCHAVVTLLLALKRLDINAPNDVGEFPLHIAVASGDKALVKLLLDRGAKINKRNGENKTSLVIAKESEFHEISQLLKDYKSISRLVKGLAYIVLSPIVVLITLVVWVIDKMSALVVWGIKKSKKNRPVENQAVSQNRTQKSSDQMMSGTGGQRTFAHLYKSIFALVFSSSESKSTLKEKPGKNTKFQP